MDYSFYFRNVLEMWFWTLSHQYRWPHTHSVRHSPFKIYFSKILSLNDQKIKKLFLKCSLVSKKRIWTTSIDQKPPNLKFTQCEMDSKYHLEATFWLRRTEGFRWSKSKTKNNTFADFILLSKKPKTFGIGPLRSPQLENEIRQNLEKISLDFDWGELKGSDEAQNTK